MVTARWVVLGLLAGATLTVPAADRNAEEEREALAAFVPDIADEEWDAALPATLADSRPRLLKGSPRAMDLPKGLPPEADCSVELGLVIRADGTQGVHAILSTNNAVYANAVVAFVRRQQYERPLRAGIPVAIRYTSKGHLTRFGPAPEGDRRPGLPEHQRKTLGKHADTVEAKAKELGLVLDYDQPPKLLKTLPPKYPDEAFRKRRNGKVLVMAVVDASGRVLDVEILESSEGFEAAALDCVRGWKFKPAAKDGKPVGTVVTAPVNFTIMDGRE